ncbi:hypothetical protein AtDm6_1698 [Acetobacter tropicalis]|uniref:Uncharacterized protein n=1 Tax=Acetobacter tropicalis TaxID=104102 RepID=A0A095B2W7_9PROT|nr:hypothetical protein AtDm6_1698 [Acetobacter tropicalis]
MGEVAKGYRGSTRNGWSDLSFMPGFLHFFQCPDDVRQVCAGLGR